MIKHIDCSNFETIENYLLSHQDKEYKTTRYKYTFEIVGDYAGIFRTGLVNAAATALHPAIKKGCKELVAYYHEGSFNMTVFQFSCVAPLGFLFIIGALIIGYMDFRGWF